MDPLSVAQGYFDLSFGFELPKTHVNIDLVFLHQELNPATHFISYPATAFDDRFKIRCAAGFNTEFFRMLDVLYHLGTF